MLSKEEFAQFGDEAVLFLHVTSHVDGDPHPDLLSRKGGRGFPYFAILDASGDLIARHEGARTVEGFRKSLNGDAVTAYQELRERAAGGDAAAKTEFFVKRLQLAHFDVATANAERKKLAKVSAEKSAEIDKLLVDLEYQGIMGAIKSRDELPAAGAKLLEMKKAGRIPTGPEAVNFWMILSFHAESVKDEPLMREIFEKVSADPSVNQRVKDQLEARLKALSKDG